MTYPYGVLEGGFPGPSERLANRIGTDNPVVYVDLQICRFVDGSPSITRGRQTRWPSDRNDTCRKLLLFRFDYPTRTRTLRLVTMSGVIIS